MTNFCKPIIVGAACLIPHMAMAADTDYSDHTAVLGYAEIITDPLSGVPGGITYFRSDLGNGQLAHDFVPGDPRRFWNMTATDITHGVKTGFLSADPHLSDQTGTMRAAAEIWNSETCADIDLLEVQVDPNTPGVVDAFFHGFGINLGLIEADITQIGFLGIGPIFPAFTSVLGVTYTLFWVDGSGNLTDIDGNGKIDAAFREIYYNDQFQWVDDGTDASRGSGYFDLPTVANHEFGHGVSVAHFGNIGVKNGDLVANPRAAMNAIYGGAYPELGGRDVGSFCSNWAQWPNK